jgi:hypothetical protein
MPIEENGNRPLGVAVADLDGDAVPDVLSASSGDGKVFWYRNDGAGAFTREVLDAALAGPLELDALDIDGDADLDVVVVSEDAANTAAVYVNDGVGTFTRSLPVTGRRAVDVEVGDWSGDGIDDVIVGLQMESDEDSLGLVLIQTDGAGGLQVTPLSEEGWRVQAIKLADVDGDGDLDLWVAQLNADPALYLLFNARGTAYATVEVQPDNGFDYQGLSVGDLNGDGFADLVAAATDIESLVLLTGDGVAPIPGEPVRYPAPFELRQNAPNPFRTETRIAFVLERPAAVTLVVYDLLGREVRRLVDGDVSAGPRELIFSAAGLPSGTYLYRLQAGGQVQSRAMILVR